jgi:hypothetical protein
VLLFHSIAVTLPFVGRLRAGEHLIEETAPLLKLSQHFGVHQLVSRRDGSMPITRLRQDVLHAPKATKPRAAAATAANIPNTFSAPTDNPYQPPTSYLL